MRLHLLSRFRRPAIMASLAGTLALLAFSVGAQQVEMPLTQYEALRAAAAVDPPGAPQPAADVTFERARLDIDVRAERAEVTQTLTFTVYAEGPQQLPIAAIGSLTAAELDGLEGRVEIDPGDDTTRWTLHVDDRGHHTVRLVSALPVVADPDTTFRSWRLTMPMPEAAIVHGTVRVPEGIDGVSSAGSASIRAADVHGAWDFVADGAGMLALTLVGGHDQPATVELPLRFVARTGVTLIAERGQRRAHATLIADIRQGRLDALTVPLPAGYETLAVTADTRIGWRVDEVSGTSRLVVTPASAVNDTLRLAIRLAAPATERFDAPLIAPEGADWTRHAVRAGAGADGILDLVDRGDARPPEGGETASLGALLTKASGPPWVLPEGGRPPRWTLRWADDTDVLAAQVDRLLVEVLLADDGRAAYRTWISVRNAGASEIAIRLPGDAQLIDARRDGQPAIPGRRGDSLVLPLAAHERPQVLQLDALTAFEVPRSGPFALPMPRLSAPASRVEVRVLAAADRGLALVNARHATSLRQPPQPSTPSASSALAQQLNVHHQAEPSHGSTGFLRPPRGWRSLEAGWNAMVNDPGALALEITTERNRKEWF